MRRLPGAFVLFLCTVIARAALAQPAAETAALPAAPPEVRAVWVDGFHAGIRTREEAAQLVADAKRMHLNTLIVQVRRRGDALYTGGLEPPLDDPNYDPSFDALAHVVDVAHQAGLQVHAWINAMPIWRDDTPPKDARHVFNLHGPGTSGDECWLTSSREGVQKFPVGYFLDPGHPAAQDHLVRVYTDIVSRYQVDGIHFDYIRYPETDDRMPRGSNVGYNAVSVARFQRSTGRSDVPLPGDDQWTAWRRQQVTALVRRVAIESRAINPRIKVSAATIAWGKPPASLADFPNVSPMQRIFQNWQAWLVEGLIDMAVPMNYAREHDPTVREWFNGWIAWEKQHKAGRHLVVGVGGYLSAQEGVLAQIDRVRTPAGTHRADGVSIFSYFRPFAPTLTGNPEQVGTAEAAPDRFDFLTQGTGSSRAAYTSPAPVPAMPWIQRPEKGWLAGMIRGADGAAIDGATIQVRRTGWFRRTRRTTSDGNGWFGMSQLGPGRYRVRRQLPGGKAAPTSVTFEVHAGAVARAVIASAR